jgi:hypothetical protein
MRRWAASDVLIVLVCAAAASSAQHDEDHGAEVRLLERAARVRACKDESGWVGWCAVSVLVRMIAECAECVCGFCVCLCVSVCVCVWLYTCVCAH